MTGTVELLGRLNAKTIRFDVGSGGGVALAPEDIAGALGMVPAGLGREVLIAVGWPDGANIKRIIDLACERAHAEICRQHAEITRQGIEHVIGAWGKRRTTQWQPGQTWPRSAYERLPAIVSACLEEITKPNHCATCGGRGAVYRSDRAHDCPACEGFGITPVSDRKRAKRIGLNESNYRRHGWEHPYTWMLCEMRDGYSAAVSALGLALRD